jgi:hypothetical protein
MAGYELDLAAALIKKKVPLTVVRDRASADLIIIGKLAERLLRTECLGGFLLCPACAIASAHMD